RQTDTTERVSISSAGVEGNEASSIPTMSADGRFVAFQSDATNLVAGDTNGQTDVFVRDRQMGITRRVSVDSSGNEANGFGSQGAAISGDGRFVAFNSSATNLVVDDTNGQYDLFVHDLQTGATERVSVDSTGAQANDTSSEPALSADGRFVAFSSYASNLISADTNGAPDIFVRDRQAGTTERVSLDNAGNQATSPA